MKTWVLLAAAAVAALAAGAQAQTEAVIEGARTAMIQDIEASRPALLAQQNRLDEIKARIIAAKTPAELIQGRKDLEALKRGDVLAVAHWQPAVGAAAAWTPKNDAEALAIQQLAARRYAADLAATSAAQANGSWDNFFDNHSRYVRPVPAHETAAAPSPAADPARYDKIRELLRSQGVSPKIIDTAIAEGMRQKVDPMIVLSVINQESNFRKNAYNKGSGCTGLMQLDPDTARDMGVRGNLYDPAANIKAGTKYLNWIANSFFKMGLDLSDMAKVPAEKLKMILASYNWGIGNVSRLVNKYGTAALDRVAPKETRNYIAEIPSRIYNWFASF